MDLFGDAPAPADSFEDDDFASHDPFEGDGEPEDFFSHPKSMFMCLGHEETESHILEQYNAGRMPHAVILHGTKGIGKATMAYRIAKFLLSQPPTDSAQDSMFADETPAPTTMNTDALNPAVRRIVSGGNPDFLAIERAFDTSKNKYKKGVAVDDIRKVPSFLRMTASGGGWRVVIIDDADTMTRSSQNAILKILEEPPKQTLLILVVHRLGALVPTILSRCQVIPMGPLSDDLMDNLLKQYDSMMPIEDRTTLKQISGGSFGKAMQYIQEGGLESVKQLEEALQTCPKWQWSTIHKLADDLARSGQDTSYRNFTDILTWGVERIAINRARELGQGGLPDSFRALSHYYAPRPLAHVLKICETLRAHFNTAEFSNLDKRQAVLGAFSILTA